MNECKENVPFDEARSRTPHMRGTALVAQASRRAGRKPAGRMQAASEPWDSGPAMSATACVAELSW